MTDEMRGSRAGEWIGALISFPSYVTGEGDPYRPTAVLWFETETGLIVDSQLVRPEQALSRAAGLFHLATKEPHAGPPRTPARLRVSDAVLATALRGFVGNTEIIVGPTPEIDEVVALMTAHFTDPNKREAESITFVGRDMKPEDVAAMFAAAARLYRVQPWAVIPADAWIGVHCEALQIDAGALVVVGQLGQSFGFSLLFDLETAAEFFEAADRAHRGKPPRSVPRHVRFAFENRREIPEEILGEITRHRWEIAGPRAYPSPVLIDSDRVGRPLTRRELAGVTAVMTALAEFVETEDELARAWDRQGAELQLRRTIQTTSGRIEVGLRAPVVLRRAAASVLDVATFVRQGELQEDDVEDYADTVLSTLADDPDVGDSELEYAELLIWETARTLGVPFTTLGPEALEGLLLGIAPERFAIPADEAELLLSAAEALMRVGDLGVAPSARESLEWLANRDLDDRLRRALADTRRYSPVKRIIMKGLARGLDLSTEQGIEQLVNAIATRRPHRGKKRASKSRARVRTRAATSTTKARAKKAQPPNKPRSKKVGQRKKST